MKFFFQVHIPFKNLSNPSDFGLTETYAFRLSHEDHLLGAWHILPKNSTILPSESIEEHFDKNVHKFNKETGDKTIVVLYLHGNTNDR